MTDLIKTAGHSDTENIKNSYVVDNIPQEEIGRAHNDVTKYDHNRVHYPKRTVDNIPTEELKGAKPSKIRR